MKTFLALLVSFLVCVSALRDPRVDEFLSRNHSTHGPRGELHPFLVRPDCTGDRHRVPFPDGTSFEVCYPIEEDRPQVFGQYAAENIAGDITMMPSMVAQLVGNFWMTLEDTSLHGPEKKARMERALKKFAATYTENGPGGLGMGTFFHELYVLDQIPGKEGMYFEEPGDVIWVASADIDYPEAYIERTLHHELFHLLQENLVGETSKNPIAINWRKRWLSTLPGGYEYKAKFSSKPVMRFTRGTYDMGFPTPYNQVSFIEDTAQFGALLISGHPEVWKCASASDRCKTKVDLTIELYQMVSPKYNEQWFRSIHQQRAADHHVAELTPSSWVPSGHDHWTNIKPPSRQDYLDKIAEITPPPTQIPNQRDPSFKSDPSVIQIGPDSINVYVETDPSAEFWGYNILTKSGGKSSFWTPVTNDQQSIQRALGIVNDWKTNYKYGLGGLMSNIGLAFQLNSMGHRGRYFEIPGDTVWMATRPEFEDSGDFVYSHKVLVRTLAHEVTHLITTQFYRGMFGSNPLEWRERWTQTLPKHFEYIGAASLGTLHYDASLFADGFLSKYNRKEMFEDVAQFGAALFNGDQQVWDCAQVSDYCAQKVNLMIEVFEQLDSGYNRQFFLGLANLEDSPKHSGSVRRVEREIRREERQEKQEERIEDHNVIIPNRNRNNNNSNSNSNSNSNNRRHVIRDDDLLPSDNDEPTSVVEQPRMSKEDLELIERTVREAREAWEKERQEAIQDDIMRQEEYDEDEQEIVEEDEQEIVEEDEQEIVEEDENAVEHDTEKKSERKHKKDKWWKGF